MIEKIINISFRASDGKIFNNEKDCIEYENYISKIEALDMNFNILKDNDRFYKAYYLTFNEVSSNEYEKILSFLNYQFGIDIMKDNYDTLYYYDEETNQFQGLSYKINTLKDDLKEYEEIKRKLEEKTNE